jgi:hypothetical protein
MRRTLLERHAHQLKAFLPVLRAGAGLRQPKRLGSRLDDVSVICQPVHDRRTEPRVGEGALPFRELTYPAAAHPADRPRPQLKVKNLTGFTQPGVPFIPVLGSVDSNQLWSAVLGVLP